MFDAAARHLNFRIAADELNLTQGAVAQQVRRLEADLGIQLFHRNSRGLALTELGQNYHSSIRRALSIIDKATRELNPENAVLRISVTPSLASKWLVPRLRSFAQMQPQINVEIIASESLTDFKTDGVDLAIRQGRPPFGEHLQAELLSPLKLRAVCSPEYKSHLGCTNRVEDFIDQQLIQDSHHLWQKLFSEARFFYQKRMLQFNQTTLAIDAAANGQGVALAPKILLLNDLDQGRLVEIWECIEFANDGYYLVYPRNKDANFARAEFISWVKSELG